MKGPSRITSPRPCVAPGNTGATSNWRQKVKTVIRILKDAALGLPVALMPIMQLGFTNGLKSPMFIGGVVVVILSALKNSVFVNWVTTGKTLSIIKDIVLMWFVGVQPIIQSGINDGVSATQITVAALLLLFTISGNVIRDQVTAASSWMLVLKDTSSGTLLVIQGIVLTGMTAGQSWGLILAGIGAAGASIFVNELREHVLGQTK